MRSKLEIMTLSATSYTELFTKIQDFQNRDTHWDLIQGSVIFGQNLYYAALERLAKAE